MPPSQIPPGEAVSSAPAALRDWPHSPAHHFAQSGAYMITAGTYHRNAFFNGAGRLTLLTNLLLKLAEEYEWSLQAWAAFSNHYHFIAECRQPGNLRRFIQHLQSATAIAVNRLDATAGRKVWFQYWDTQLTYQRSYLARLHYVHQNPVLHGLVRVPERYLWCSAAWFERNASRAFYRTVMGFQCDQLDVIDSFDVPPIP